MAVVVQMALREGLIWLALEAVNLMSAFDPKRTLAVFVKAAAARSFGVVVDHGVWTEAILLVATVAADFGSPNRFRSMES